MVTATSISKNLHAIKSHVHMRTERNMQRSS